MYTQHSLFPNKVPALLPGRTFPVGERCSMDILPLLDELRTIACNGLTFATNPYDVERYQRLVELVSTYYGQALDLPPSDVRQRLQAELGYITPKVGGDAAIFDEQGRILLVHRSDSGRWCLPCGFTEPNESPAETAVRETREETGLEVVAVQLVGVYTRLPSAEFGPHTLVSVVYLCNVTGGTLQGSIEGDVRYWPIEDVPIWHGQHHSFTLAARAAWLARQSTR